MSFEILRTATPARVQIDRAGASLSTSDLLQFQADQAAARDAVHRPFDCVGMATSLGAQVVRSRVTSVAEHLLRPDLGRRVRAGDLPEPGTGVCLVAVVSDGLSSGAAERYAPRVLAALREERETVVVPFGRVAIGDEIGEALDAEFVVVLLGERPGLTAPESLGIYLTYRPRLGRTDAERVCLSNVGDHGTSPEEAATRLEALIAAARYVKGTGVAFADPLPILDPPC